MFSSLKWRHESLSSPMTLRRYPLIFKYSILPGGTGRFARSFSDVGMNLGYAGIDRSRSLFCSLYYCGYLRHMAQFPSLFIVAAASNEHGASLFLWMLRLGVEREPRRFFIPSYKWKTDEEKKCSPRLCTSSFGYLRRHAVRVLTAGKRGRVPPVLLNIFAIINSILEKIQVNFIDS